MFKPIVVIPVYNHPLVIEKIVTQVYAQGFDCLLVNDGSNTACTEILRNLEQYYSKKPANKVLLTEHVRNLGKGAAVTTGLKTAFNLGYTHASQIDADGQHEISDIQRFFQIAQKYPDAVVCGYPLYDKSVPKLRFYARYLTHIWVWINTLSLRIKDSMCGFRVYPLASINALLKKYPFSTHMSWDTEILVRADWEKITIINTPTHVHYPEDGISHFRGLFDNLLISRMHAALFLGMLLRIPRLILRIRKDKPRYH